MNPRPRQRRDNPHRPLTRSEMALPLLLGDQAIGAVTVQSTQEAAFSQDDTTALQAMADQLAIAIHNAKLHTENQSLLEAAERLADVLPDVHYLIVGERWSQKEESRQFEAILRRPAAESLRDRFHLLGYRDDVNRLLNELTLLVHPARQEPLGRVLLEAAASGVAVVASDVGGTTEIFPNSSRAARLVQPNDAEALAAAIEDLLGNPAARGSMGGSARRRVEEAFAIETAAAGLIGQYHEVLGLQQ